MYSLLLDASKILVSR